MVSEMTMVNDNTHSTSRLQPHLTPTQHTPVTSQHSHSQQQQQRQTRHLPPTPSNHVRRQLSSPQVLCKVFVSGIGWGSQVRVHCSHLSACALCDVSETDMFSIVFSCQMARFTCSSWIRRRFAFKHRQWLSSLATQEAILISKSSPACPIIYAKSDSSCCFCISCYLLISPWF